MNSLWSESTVPLKFDALEGTKSADVLIIGGGMAGLLTAYRLKKAGVDCIVAESGRICGGTTKNTTAKITYQHGFLYDKLIKQFGIDKARLFLEAQTEALKSYEALSSDIDCDFEKKESCVYTLNDREKATSELCALRSLGVKAKLSQGTALPFETAGAVRVPDQAQFHPLKFAYGIARDMPIYENTRVLELLPGKAVTEHGLIRYKKIIVATHFPFINKHGFYFLKMYQHRSYVIALENASDVGGMYVDEADVGFSFRNHGSLLLLGGGDHRTGKQGGGWRELEKAARRFYPKATVRYRWAAQDCMSLDGVPYIGQYAKNTPDLYVATGFNKWGMSSSMVASSLLTDLLCGKSNRYAEVFSPSRSILHPQLAINAFHSVVGLLTPTVPRCPHLGCALKYNPYEHSWDCPCHGSRFSETGELLNNPATKDKKL